MKKRRPARTRRHARQPSRRQYIFSKKRILLAVLALLLVSGGVYAWYSRPVVAEVNYQPCAINYGAVVAQWDGAGEKQWNDTEYHYQVRRFSLVSKAPGVFFPNTIEANPTRIATGGEYACDPEFDETVDLASARYRWQGARATGLHLGVPKRSPAAAKALLPRITNQPASHLAVPVLTNASAAAVWVDDGASASLINGEDRQSWWCVNYRKCGDITKQQREGRPVRGAGYQYVTTNCPLENPCNEEWYHRRGAQEAIDKQRGLLQPFTLRLEAVSTYADTAGAAMLVTFRYPKVAQLETAVTGEMAKLTPGSSFTIDLALYKQGPAVDSLIITPVTDEQPLQEVEPIRLTQDQLKRLNTEDSVEIPLTFTLASSAQPGACYSLELMVGIRQSGQPLASPEVKYCVAITQTAYTYSVHTRGDTTADLAEFATQAAQTLRDERGWAAANIVFQQVESGGDFILWLAAPEKMTSFSSGCDATYSCRVGPNVIINDDRWQGATPSWNQAGGSLRGYRHMVINHEVGHFLGFGHASCPRAKALAPVMMQQSIDLDGCRFNPWPTARELAAL